MQKKDNQIKENLQKKKEIHSKRTTKRRKKGKTYIQEREQKGECPKTDKNEHKKKKIWSKAERKDKRAKHTHI